MERQTLGARAVNDTPRAASVTKQEKSDRAWAKRLWDNYKLTIAQWQTIYTSQGGVCYGCGEPEPVKGRRLAVDHHHGTGLVRGLLCSRCNPVLGKIERAFMRYGLGKVLDLSLAKWVLRMAHYVSHEPATKALGTQHFGYSGRTGTKKHRARLRRERRVNDTPRATITEKTEGKR